MAHLILDGAKEHYILDIEHSDKAIEIIETLLPAIPILRRKRIETEGRECFVYSLPFLRTAYNDSMLSR